jgi:hypothetical protein
MISIKFKEKRKMQISKSKTAAIAIAIFLTFSMGASLMLVPSASAHSPSWNIPTFAYINAAPDPVGLGQKVYIIMWIDDTYDPASALSNNYRFQNYELTITAPDGTKTTQNFPVVSDPTSSQDYTLTPSQVGTYNLTFTFPGQNITATNDSPYSAYVGDYYMPSSASTSLTVQQTAISTYPTTPLPTAYWTRPIYGENSNWYAISSNWLGSGAPGYSGYSMYGSAQSSYPGDAVGSLTGHVMWTTPIESGGVVGGNNFAIAGDTYFEGSAYNQRFTNPIIIDGMLIFTEPVSFAGSSSGPTVCVNLQTGQQIWSSTTMGQPSFAYIYDVQDPNQHGVYPPMLIATSGTSWLAYDAYTGTYMFTVTNVPSGTTILGPNGEHLILSLVNLAPTTITGYGPYGPITAQIGPSQWYLQEWNSSKLWEPDYSGSSTSPPVVPVTLNGTWTGGYVTAYYYGMAYQSYVPSLYDFNVSIPSLNTLAAGGAAVSIDYAFYNNMLIGYVGSMPSSATIAFRTISSTPYTYFALNLNQNATIGTSLWTNTVTAPTTNVTVLTGPADPTANGGAGVFTESHAETMQWVGYSMSTGKQIWGPVGNQSSFDYFGNPATPNVNGIAAYGKLYSSGFGGICYCYNMANGDLLWTYGNGGEGNTTFAGLATAFGEYPTFIQAIGNGVVYLVTTEHTVETPIFKGALARAINATTGAEIWTLSDYTGEFFAMSYAMADGYNTWFNGYDDQVYVVGQGPSATTVQAPLSATTVGNSVVIQGTVMDISAGTTQTEQAADFPNGVPVSSDASMKEWMGYVYQQQPLPTNFTGVTVQIAAIDPNGNHVTLGTATTDANGMFHYTWTTPNVPGTYTVYATFAGTNGYYGSNAETNMVVQSAPTATAAPTPTPTSLADQYFLPVSIAIIIVIVIVGAVLALLMLRKHP